MVFAACVVNCIELLTITGVLDAPEPNAEAADDLTTLIQLMRLFQMARIITTLGRALDEIGFGLKMISSKMSADNKAAWTDFVDFKCTTKGKVKIMIKNRGGLEELQEVEWRLRSAHRHLLALKYKRTRATVGDAGEVRGEDVWLKVDLYQFPALSRFISEKGFWTWRADAHTQLSTNLNDTICDIILAISDADGPKRLTEPPDFLTQRDPTGATVIHALFIAGAVDQGRASPRALKVGLKILDRWPQLLSDPHKESDALIRKLGLDDKSITDKEKLKLARAWGVFYEKKKANEDRDTWTSQELDGGGAGRQREKGREAEFTQGTFDGENVLPSPRSMRRNYGVQAHPPAKEHELCSYTDKEGQFGVPVYGEVRQLLPSASSTCMARRRSASWPPWVSRSRSAAPAEGERVLTGKASAQDLQGSTAGDASKFSKNMFTPLHAAVGAVIEMVDFLITLPRKGPGDLLIAGRGRRATGAALLKNNLGVPDGPLGADARPPRVRACKPAIPEGAREAILEQEGRRASVHRPWRSLQEGRPSARRAGHPDHVRPVTRPSSS